MKPILLAILLACSASAQVFVATATNTGFANPTLTVNLPSSSVIEHDLLTFVVDISTSGGYTGGTVTDNAGNTATCTPYTTESNRIVAFCYILDSPAKAGTYTATLTPTGATGGVGAAFTIGHWTSGLFAIDVSIPSNVGIAGPTNTFQTPSITTMTAGDLVLGWVFANANATAMNPFTVDSGATAHQPSGAAPAAFGELDSQAIGTYQPTFMNAGNTAGFGVTGIAAFTVTPLPITSNCVTQGNCSANCGGTPGSLSFYLQPNTQYTSPMGKSYLGVDCRWDIPYDSVNSTHCGEVVSIASCIQEWKPHGQPEASLYHGIGWHGGGGYGGYATDTFGGNSTAGVIQFIQNTIDMANPVGGRGVDAVLADYPWSGNGSSAPWPEQYLLAACAVSWSMGGNYAGGYVPSNMWFYGPSFGATYAHAMATAPTSVFGTPRATCANPDARPSANRTVAAWLPSSWCLPTLLLSSYTNNSSGATVTDAFNFQFGTSTGAGCTAADTTAQASPYLQINSGNLSQILTGEIMFQFTGPDQLVEPTWAGSCNPTCGNMALVRNAYAALKLYPPIIVYPDAPSTCNNYMVGGGHEICLGNFGNPGVNTTMADAINFIMGVGGTASSGTMGAGAR